MENKEIIEGNKLIAEFDNRIKLKKCKVNGFYPDGYEYIGFLPTDIGNTRGINDLKYHTSWDWIMPVVEKMNKEISDLYKSIYILEQKCCFWDLKITDDIKTVYKSVVEFIKWYNGNKNNGK